jgi:hypothetical protein
VQHSDPQTDKTNQEEKDNANDSVSSPNGESLDTIPTLDKDEGSKFQEGGIRGWATVIGA